MAKKGSGEEVSAETKKERKKQARQEAKTMLQLEQAQKNEQKAAKKVMKAQEELDASRTQIHKYEAKLAEMRAPHHEPAGDALEAESDRQQPELFSAESSEEDSSQSSSENHTSNALPWDKEQPSLPESNGHTEVSSEQENAYVEEGQ